MKIEWDDFGINDRCAHIFEGWHQDRAYTLSVAGGGGAWTWQVFIAYERLARGKASTEGRAIGAGKRAALRDAKKGESRE